MSRRARWKVSSLRSKANKRDPYKGYRGSERHKPLSILSRQGALTSERTRTDRTTFARTDIRLCPGPRLYLNVWQLPPGN